MSVKVVIMTEIISPYRTPVFNALADMRRVDLHVIFLAETDPTFREWLIYKNEIRFSYEVLPSWRKRIKGFNVLLNRGVKSALARQRPDVIICGGYNYLASWQANLWAKSHGARFVLWSESTRLDNPRRAAKDWLKRLFMKGCDGFVVPGKSAREYLHSFGIPDKAIATAPNAVDTGFFSSGAEAARRDEAALRLRLGLPPRYFLFVGRLVRMKGVFDLIAAYEQLKPKARSDIGLVFAGAGPGGAELAKLAVRIEPGTIRFVGFQQRESLPSYYALAEALVLPSKNEAWGLVVNEAMACGLPVICTDVVGCAADLVKDRWNGYLTPVGDIGALCRSMAAIAEEPQTKRSMGAHSADWIRRFSPEACASGLAAVAFKRKLIGGSGVTEWNQ